MMVVDEAVDELAIEAASMMVVDDAEDELVVVSSMFSDEYNVFTYLC